MTKDLENTLDELGTGYRAVVERLTAGAAVEPRPGRLALSFPPRRHALAHAPFLAAASIAAILGLVCVFLCPRGQNGVPALPCAAHEYRLAEMACGADLSEMIRTQNADGSWKNDFLTRRNASALEHCTGQAAKVAYKKAMRNLRVRGLL